MRRPVELDCGLSRCQPIATPTVIFGAQHLRDLIDGCAKDPDFQSADQAGHGSALPAATAAARNRSEEERCHPPFPLKGAELKRLAAEVTPKLANKPRSSAGEMKSATYWTSSAPQCLRKKGELLS